MHYNRNGLFVPSPPDLFGHRKPLEWPAKWPPVGSSVCWDLQPGKAKLSWFCAVCQLSVSQCDPGIFCSYAIMLVICCVCVMLCFGVFFRLKWKGKMCVLCFFPLRKRFWGKQTVLPFAICWFYMWIVAFGFCSLLSKWSYRISLITVTAISIIHIKKKKVKCFNL